jgi:hypothetical protein
MRTEPTQPEDLASLYRRAFAEYGVRALWNMRPVEQLTAADALAIPRLCARIAAWLLSGLWQWKEQ